MIIIAVGMPGFGKTTMMHDFVRLQWKTHRFFILERSNEWLNPEHIMWRGNAPDMTVYERGATLPENPNDWPPTGVFVFVNWESKDVTGLALKIGNVTIVDDEIDISARKKGWEQNALREFVHRGRHLVNADGEVTEGHVIGACRRPQNLHNDITDLCSEMYIFHCKGSRTIGRLIEDAMIEDDEADIVRELPKFQFLHYPSGKRMSIAPIGDGANTSTQPSIEQPKEKPKVQHVKAMGQVWKKL